MLFTHELLRSLVPQQARRCNHTYTILRVNAVFQGVVATVLKMIYLMSLNADKLTHLATHLQPEIQQQLLSKIATKYGPNTNIYNSR